MQQRSKIVVHGVAVLAILLGVTILIGCTQGLAGSNQNVTPAGAKVAPPWLTTDSTCEPIETSAQSRGDPHSFDSAGKSTGLLPQGQVTCVLEIQICSDMIVKSQVVNTSAGEKCPDSLHFSRAPKTKICCLKWHEAKRTKSPCDPLTDIDCDGAVNKVDEYPLDFTRQ